MKWSALLVLCAATFGVETEAKGGWRTKPHSHRQDSLIAATVHAPSGQLRGRRLIKAHGQWCGPNWTGGMAISAGDYMSEGRSFSAYCVDEADCACRQHDYDCAVHDGCCKEDDDKLIDALQGTDSPFLIAAMKAARLFHKSCSKSTSWWDEDEDEDIQNPHEANAERSEWSNLFDDDDEDAIGFEGAMGCCQAMIPSCLECHAKNQVYLQQLRNSRERGFDMF